MRTTSTMTISLPPAMVEEFEKVRKAENRTKSELVREALRQYFSGRFPVERASKAHRCSVHRRSGLLDAVCERFAIGGRAKQANGPDRPTEKQRHAENGDGFGAEEREQEGSVKVKADHLKLRGKGFMPRAI